MSPLIPFFTRCLSLVVALLTVSATAQTPLAITDFQLDLAGRAVVRVPSEAGFYFILYRGDEITAIQAATDVESLPSAGDPPSVELIDARPPTPLPSRFYRVERVPLATPKDADADGIDDVFELNSRPLLDPLNPADAALDPDNDGRSTLEEYRAGTNPFVANPAPAPASPRLSPPASSTTGGRLELTGFGTANTYIRVEGGAALATNRVGADGAFLVSVPLSTNRINRLFVTAVNPQGNTSPGVPIEILQDSQPPTLHVDFPTNRMSFTTANTLVAGRVGDSLSGYAGLSVWVHASPAEGNPPLASTSFPPNSPYQATVDVGIGPNGTYERADVPLVEGTNIVSVVAVDALGNRTVRRAEVIRRPLVGPRLVMRSGDRQMTNVLRRLEQPLVVRAENPDGSPIPDVLLTLDVTRSDGRLLPANTNALASDWTLQPNATTNGAMVIQVRTDANGEAAAWWTLGSEAGCANNRVCVNSGTLDSCVYFCASAMGNPGRQINIGSGNHQKVETGGATVEPLRAWVSDGLNPAAGVPVTFRVVEGNGRLVEGGRDGLTLASPRPSGAGAEGSSLTVGTGRTGHASVGFVAGSDAGQNVIEASFPGQFGLPATFIVYGVARDLTQPATFTGLILDNTSCPIGNAYCELEVAHYKVGTFSDSQGRFRFENVPGGMGHLHVNGRTATSVFTNAIPTNSFPALHYSVTTVPNAENSLPSPVLLPRLNPANAHVYDGTKDLVLTCEGIDGLRMTIRANSMRDAQGNPVTPANPMVVSLDQVHHDDVPMPMPDGVAPAFAWTLQPGGATFDPPVAIEYPNMSGLPPGSIAYFLSFNHDTERFEIVSSGHITSDGSTIVTDPGSGLTLAGWGCNCPPYAITASCNNCNCPDLGPSSESTQQCSIEVNGCGPGWLPDAITRALADRPSLAANGMVAIFRWDPRFLYSPNLSPFINFKNSCDDHDRGYATLPPPGRTPAQWKLEVDLRFWEDMSDSVTQALNAKIIDLEQAKRAWKQAALYYVAVNDYGEAAFLRGQEEARGLLACYDSESPVQLQARNPPSAASIPYLDTDADGLDDDWEARYGLSLNANDFMKDNDSDGLPNGVEFFYDFDPTSPDSNGDGISDINQFLIDYQPGPTSLDETWNISIAGQKGMVGSYGGVIAANIAIPDLYGPTGPGSAPDSVADDWVRMLGFSLAYDPPMYAFSEPIRLSQAAIYGVTNLTFTDTPPRQADRLTIAAVNSSLQAGGAAHPIQVTATYADGTTADVTLRTAWTSYRVSNPNIARVSPDGLLIPKTAGTVYITAVNEAATVVQGFTIVDPTDQLTGIVGRVVDEAGAAISGARIVLEPARALQVLSAEDGTFEFRRVPTRDEGLSLRISAGSGRNLSHAVVDVHFSPGLIADLGAVVLRPIAVSAAPGIVAWWSGDLGLRDEVGTNDLVARGIARVGDGIIGSGFELGGGHLTSPVMRHQAISNTFSVAAWINVSEVRNEFNGYTIASQSTGTFPRWNFGVNRFGALELSLAAYNARGESFGVIETSVSAYHKRNMWAFMAVTVDLLNAEVRLYIDGVQVLSIGSGPGSPLTNLMLPLEDGPIVLGARDIPWFDSRRPERQFTGAMDDVSLWSRVLSISEIEALYRRSGRDVSVVTLTGRVLSSEGLPLADAAISASIGDLVTKSSHDGLFVLQQVPIRKGLVTVSVVAGEQDRLSCASFEVNPLRGGGLDVGDLIVAPLDLPPTNGLIGWWAGNGNFHDSAETNAITPIGRQVIGPGRLGTGFQMDGWSGYLTAPWTSSGSLSNQFSFGAWIRPESLWAQQAIANQHTADQSTDALWYLEAAQAKLRFYLKHNNDLDRGFIVETQDNVLVAGKWQWVGVSVDLSVGQVFIVVDGRSMKIEPIPEPIPWARFQHNVSPLKLGSFALEGRRKLFRGSMDEVMLWRRALTVEELAAVAQRGCGTVGVNLGAE